MNKEWKCEDCCVLGTDACYYGVREGNNHACSQLVADHDKVCDRTRNETLVDVYERAETICEICEYYTDTCYKHCGHAMETLKKWIDSEIKEQTNE